MPRQEVTSDSRIVNLENELRDARYEIAHLAGLVAVLKSERERWRHKVLAAASGNVCSKCEGEMQPAAAANG